MAVDDVISDAKSRLETLLAPIDGGVGIDLSYDESFEALKNEVDKLQALAGGKVDWGAVAVGADQILSERSKDFRVALYYATAKAHTDGLRGLLDGFVALTELTTAFWEPMYPALKRPKARGNLMSWFGDLVHAQYQAFVPTAADSDLVRAIEQVSDALDRDLRDKLGDSYPGIMNLRNLARRLVAALPVAAPPPAAAPASPPPQPSAASGSAAAAPAPVAAPPPPVASAPSPAFAAPSSSPTTPDDAVDFVTECGVSIASAADVLRTGDPGDPRSYRFRRVGTWLRLVQTPPNDGGRTIVPAPPAGIKADLDQMMAAENYLGVIAAAEEAASTFILWLDPHRYTANAMDRLGAIFINAKKAVVFEVAALLARIPQLPSLSFDDDTPFADGQTKMWLEAEVQSAFGSGKGGSSTAGGSASALDGPIAEARALAASGKLGDAIDLVSIAASTAASGADRFRGRLAIARLCLQSGQFAVARAQLEGLVWLTEQHKLTDWEPALCADLYSALYAAHRGLNRGDEVPADARARETAAFERLCQLDPNLALKLSEG